RLAAEEAARVKAEQEAARIAAQARMKLEAEVVRLKAQADAEAHARQEIETAQRLAAEEAARVKAEQEAARIVAQARMKLEEDVARLKAQADAEAHARQEIETAQRLAAEEAARVKAEQEAARAREEVERERAAAREESARLVREAADAARVKAEQEAAKAEAALRAEEVRHASEVAEAKLSAEQHAAQVLAEAEARASLLAQERAKLEAEVSRLKENAKMDERLRIDTAARLEEEAAQVRQASERLVRDAEAARIKAEEEVSLVRRESEQQLLQAREAAAGAAREHAEIVAAQRAAQVDLISLIPDEDVSKTIPNDPVLAAVVRLNARHADDEKSVVSALDELTQAAAAAASRDSSQWVVRGESSPATDRRQAAPAVPGCDSRGGNNGVPVVERRTTTAAVLFFDIVGYTKLSDQRQIALKQQFNQLVGNSLDPLDAGERIILDTGDGAAIGFLQHPTDALESAIHFRAALTANSHFDYPDLRVRMGIHLGPVSLVKDMNGQINMLGDGINSAQRVMSFAGHDQIYISRAYFEFVSNLSDEYKDLFRYRGAQQDKHGREHQIYELLDANAEVAAPLPEVQSPAGFEGFDLDAFDLGGSPAEPDVLMPEIDISPQLSAADQLLQDAAGLENSNLVLPVEAITVEVKPITVQPEIEAQYSEQEAKLLADAQAKKWQEAEKRAAEDARKTVPPPQVAPQPVARLPRVPRKPKPWGKLAAGLAAALVATLFVLPAVMPTQGYLASIEQALSAKLQQPVHIARLSGRILPAPRLILSEVSIGGTRQIQADQVQVNFAYSALFGATRVIDSLNLEGVRVKEDALLQVAGWLQQTASDAHYPVAHIAFAQAKLESDSVQLSDVGGEVDFDASGRFAEAKFNADGHKLALEIHAGPKLPFSLTLHDRALPLFSNWIFEDLKANGELSLDEMRISDLDGRIRGGVLTGDARINWREGWRVQGALEAKVIPLQNINKLLGGDLDGTARFQMQSGSLAKLADTAVLNGVFNVNKGIVNGVDIVETARLRSRENLPGGRTHFDTLSGEFNYASELYRFSQLKITDSVVRAAGTLAVSRQKLSGTLSADLSMRAGMGAVMLQVEGTTESPALHVAH
ncbi:MAG: adenylate/guanylate cyclase domain-containing protein, partial [Nitrosomonadales bacterium]